MSSFRFLHAADLHLDSPLKGLERHDDLSIDRIRSASRRALDNMVDTAIEHDVAFVVIAGDLYDGDWKTISTGRYMATALGRLIAHGIRVFLLQGNHDAASVLTRDLPLQAGIDRFPSPRPGSFLIEDLGVALHGQSFANRHMPHDMTPAYPVPVPGYFNIGVLHTSLSGHGQHETYAPCAPETLRAKNYDYWALGHVHERMILTDGTPIVFPGVLQGRHIRETGEKGVVLVSTTDHRIDSITPIACDVVRWHAARFDCTGIENFSAFEDRLGAFLRDIAHTHEGHLCVIRLTIAGTTALHDTLKRQGQTLREAVQHLAAMSGGEIELEKLLLDTTPVATQTRLAPDEGDGFALSGLVHEAASDETLLKSIGEELDSCLKTLNLGDIAPDSLLDRINRRDWASILPELNEALCDRLSGKGDAS
ncbi:DNA repair exonuclease [Asaia spathodeae]|uniref:metallophosphoesterase family protein n=1 Tax=Asaia spathodeae TaxID=657016 RepID=UPI002FC33E6C